MVLPDSTCLIECTYLVIALACAAFVFRLLFVIQFSRICKSMLARSDTYAYAHYSKPARGLKSTWLPERGTTSYVSEIIKNYRFFNRQPIQILPPVADTAFSHFNQHPPHWHDGYNVTPLITNPLSHEFTLSGSTIPGYHRPIFNETKPEPV